jgi:hypothetical protein
MKSSQAGLFVRPFQVRIPTDGVAWIWGFDPVQARDKVPTVPVIE